MSERTGLSVHPAVSSPDGSALFADVIIPRHFNRSFTYRIPSDLQARLSIGSRVVVPFGPVRLQGVVVSLSRHLAGSSEGNGSGDHPLTAARLRDILAVHEASPASTLPADLLELSRLLAERYLAPWGQCLRLILPPVLLRTRSRYRLTQAGRALVETPAELNRCSPSGQLALSRLARVSNGLSSETLRQALRGSFKTTLASLKRKGLVREFSASEADIPQEPAGRLQTSIPRPFVRPPAASPGDSPMSEAPALAHDMQRLHAAIADRRYSRLLLYASRPERFAYMEQAVTWAMSHQRAAIIITPEIARAEALGFRFKARWGEQVELVHGGLSLASRRAAWSRVRQGAVRLVIGTRSAIFSPLPPLGLICVEDDHDSSLKEETEPRYHAREAAMLRARQHEAVLLLLSAHPSLEALHGHESDRAGDGRPSAAVPPCGSVPAPVIVRVDLRQQPYDTLLSEPMIAGMQAALDARAGVVLFLNRKGFASALWCRECGKSSQCPQCSITLTFFKQAGRLSCHYCGTSTPLPDACPFCLAAKLEPVGAGTERVEAMIRRLFPNARIGRLDRHVPESDAETLRRQVISGEVDILIGTQSLFHEHALPRVGFVGLIHADAGLHAPDFRAAERTFHTLGDAVALARSREEGGQVVLQTYIPTHHAIAAITEGDPDIFYDQERAFRRQLGYPPFAHLISLRVTGTHQEQVTSAAERWAVQLRDAAAATRRSGIDHTALRHPPSEELTAYDPTVLGPVPAAISQLRGRYRRQILVKSVSAEAARATVRATLDGLERDRGRAGLKYEIDVDPVAMM